MTDWRPEPGEGHRGSPEPGRCGEYGEETLQRYLDGDLHPVETYLLEEHLERCDECRRKARFERAFLDRVRIRLAEVSSPPELRERVRSLISAL